MKSKIVFFLILIVMIFSNAKLNAQTMPPIEPGVSQTLAKWRAANYSDVRYKLNLTLEKKSPTLKGTIEIAVNLRGSEGETERKNITPPQSPSFAPVPIVLDWRKIKGHESLSTLSNVEINGKPARFEEKDEHLIFKDGVKTGENVIKLDFTSPILTSGSAITRYIDKEDGSEYIYSLFVPSDASTAFPVFDQPDLKARFELNLIAPNGWRVISNAVGQTDILFDDSEMSDTEIKLTGMSETQFSETEPISTYVFAFAAGDFAEFEDEQSPFPSKLYVRKSQVAKLKRSKRSALLESASSTRVREKPLQSSSVKAKDSTSLSRSVGGRDVRAPIEDVRAPIEEVFRLNREAVKYYEDYFDYKFPFSKYDLVLIPEFPFGGMEHAGATFLRESTIIFPTEPTSNDYISRAGLIFHETAHQWFGDTVTMKWFDDLWLKEGFATFMAYKAMEKIMPEYDAGKIFYERTKQRAYLTDVTRGTTPIYQEIPNLSAAKSAYGNIVYQKAPSFLKQAEFYLGEKEFQTAVRSFLKKHEFANAEWMDLVNEFEKASKEDLKDWANVWVKDKGLFKVRIEQINFPKDQAYELKPTFEHSFGINLKPIEKFKILVIMMSGQKIVKDIIVPAKSKSGSNTTKPNWNEAFENWQHAVLVFPNYQDYGYGIFLLDEKSREYILKNIQNEKDDFLRSMMWGSLWDSVRFYELDPRDYVELVIKNINVEKDVVTISSLLNRVSIAMTYYIPEGGNATVKERVKAKQDSTSTKNTPPNGRVSAGTELSPQIEKLLLDKMKNAPSTEQKITFYRAFLNLSSSDGAKRFLKDLLSGKTDLKDVDLKTKDKFDIVTKLIVLGDADALKLLAKLEKTETDDAAKRYAYAARAGIPTAENKAKYWNDFVKNKEISESWIEEAFEVWNTPRHSELTLPYLDKALAELPNLKRNRKIFFVNGWLSEFIGGQKSEEALNIVNKFLEDNPKLDEDLQRKVLENVDGLERAVKIRGK